jgi:eukaryotic-like serine/threonine-protein kinase
METKICPYCREVIKIDAVKCKHCQTVLSGPADTLVLDPATGVSVALAAKYEFLGEIGRGGMAIVYKARHRGLGRTVALKVLPQQLAYDKELLDRFHREARSLASLKHPSIVPVYDEGFENGVHFFAMEFLEGKSLSTLITEKGRLPAGEIVPIVTQIAGALDYIHSHGLVHRDVKSSNIFINNQGVPVLMDFGVAHVAHEEQLTARGMILGTPEFMSPEQAGGMHVDGRSDLYSLGVVLYQALSGAFPHVGDTPLMTLHKIVTEPYVPLCNLAPVPEWLEYATNRCLEKDPKKRVQSGKVLVQLLREENQAPRTAVHKKPAQPARFTAAPRPQERKRGTGWKIATVLVIVLALVSIGFFAKAFFAKPAMARVPSLVGDSPAEAERKLQQSRLNVGATERKWGAYQQHDLVIEQRPAGGTEVAPGSAVTLVVGIGKTVVPDLKGLPIQDAVASLHKSALALGETTRVAGLPEQHDRVMLVYPRPGTELGKDARVNLSIGE